MLAPGWSPLRRLLLRLAVLSIATSWGPADFGSRCCGTLSADALEVKAGASLTKDEAFALLKAAGGEKAWSAFEEDHSLLEFAFSDQATFPTPSGGLPSAGKVMSQSPYVTVFDDFLTEKECDFLRSFARTRLAPAMVVQSGDNWYDTQTQTRNNEQHWLTQQEEKSVPALRHLLKRMHRASRVPDEHAEALQIGRYNVSTKYEGHLDTDPPNRVARPMTLIVYLADVGSGGDTLFPVGRDDCTAVWHEDKESNQRTYGAATCCATPEKDAPETVRVSPKLGRAVLFFSHRPDGSVDQQSKHIGCPVVAGEKWIAQRWFRFEPYNRVAYGIGTPGFDARFDGLPPAPALQTDSSSEGLWKVSDIGPRVFLQRSFVDDFVHSHLLRLAEATLASSGTVDEFWLDPEAVVADDTLRSLAERARQFARLPPHSEAPAVLRLRRLRAGSGGEHLHRDSPPPPSAPGAGGQAAQLASVLVYLRVPADGGHVAFPEALQSKSNPLACGRVGDDAQDDLAACCASEGMLKLRPSRGDAVLLYSHDVEGKLDERSSHVVCPVSAGESLVAEFSFIFPNFVLASGGTAAKAASASQPLVEFENMRREALQLFWVPPAGGEEAAMGELPAGPHSVRPFTSFAGHVFHVRDADGNLLQEVKVGAEPHQRVQVGASEEL